MDKTKSNEEKSQTYNDLEYQNNELSDKVKQRNALKNFSITHACN